MIRRTSLSAQSTTDQIDVDALLALALEENSCSSKVSSRLDGDPVQVVGSSHVVQRALVIPNAGVSVTCSDWCPKILEARDLVSE